MGHRVEIAQSAHATILAACREAPGETGGVLVGFLGEEVTFVTHALVSGVEAERHGALYVSTLKDVAYLQKDLNRLLATGFQYVGPWHKHPAGCAGLSGTDRTTLREILADPDYNLSGFLVTALAVPTFARRAWRRPASEDLAIHCFFVTKTPFNITEIPAEVVPDTKIARPRAEKAPLEVSAPFDLWGLRDPWTTSYGRTRLEAEIATLQADGRTVRFHTHHGLDLALAVTSDTGGTVVFLLPREYPFAPPRIFAFDGHGAEELLLDPILVRWSSAFELADCMLPADAILRRRSVAGLARSADNALDVVA